MISKQEVPGPSFIIEAAPGSPFYLAERGFAAPASSCRGDLFSSLCEASEKVMPSWQLWKGKNRLSPVSWPSAIEAERICTSCFVATHLQSACPR